MNTFTAVEKESGHSYNRFTSSFFPSSALGKLLVLAFMPSLLVLFSVGASFLKPSIFTPYFPILSLLTSLICLFFRTKGVAASYTALALFLLYFFKDLDPQTQLWQMSLVFSLAINLFILLLCIEEIEALLAHVTVHSQVNSTALAEAKQELKNVLKTKEEEQKAFETEIEKFKEEAEQRKIEKRQDSELIEMIQSEIELLTSQKEEILKEARLTRQEGIEKLQTAEQILAEIQTHDDQEFITEISSQQETILRLQEQAFREKAMVEQLKEDKSELSRLLFQKTLESQEALLSFQVNAMKCPPATKAKLVEPHEIKQLKDEKAQAEGLYFQLREQFQEKTNILNQTRKELFRTQEKLLVLEKEVEFSKIECDREEGESHERDIGKLLLEIAGLQSEITHLEELVSHVLSL